MVQLQAANRGLDAVWADDDSDSVVLGGTFVLMVGDGKRPWEIVPVRGRPQLAAAAGAGTLRVAVGYPHTILVSNDGGGKWASRAVAKHALADVACTADGVIVCAGREGAYRSADAGKTFKPCGGQIRVVAVADGRVLGVETRYRDSLLHEWDDASGWWREISTIPDHVKGLTTAGSAWLAIGFDGAFRSIDRGATWDQVLAKGDTPLCAVAGNGDGVAVIGGYRGYLAVSRDAGATWTRSVVTDRNLEAACVTTSGVIWVVGDDGVVLRSGDGPLAAVAVEQGTAKPTGRSKRPAEPRDAGAVLRAAVPLPVWSATEPLGDPIHAGPVTAVAFVDDDRVVSGDGDGVLLLHTRDRDARWTTTTLARGRSTAIRALAVAHASGEPRAILAAEDTLEVIDPARGGVAPRSRKLAATHLIARGARIAAAQVDHEAVALFELDDDGTLSPVHEIEVEGEVVDLDLSRDGARVAIACADGTVAIHDAATGARRSSFHRAGARVRFAADPEQLYLVCGSYDLQRVSAAKGGKRGKLAATGRQRAIVTSAAIRYVGSLSVHDELDVIAADREVTLLGWDAGTDVTLCGAPRVIPDAQIRKRVFSRHRFVLEEHAAITALAISDGGRVAAGDLGGEVAIFDAPTLALERAAMPRSTRVQPALESPLLDFPIVAAGRDDDGRVLLLAADRRVRVVDIDQGSVLAGPAVELAEPAALWALGDVLVVAGAGGWQGHDLVTGSRRWASSFPVSVPVRFRGALYGFETRSGSRISQALYRLDVATGAVTTVSLPLPPGIDDARGYGDKLTPTPQGLLVELWTNDRRQVAVLFDPDTAVARFGPDVASRGTLDADKRHALFADKTGGEIRDLQDPSFAIIAEPRIRGYASSAIPMVGVGRVIALDNHRGLLAFDLDGVLVATLRGLHGGESLVAGPAGTAALTFSTFPGGVVRRWPIP
jgi:hypothetical protein